MNVKALKLAKLNPPQDDLLKAIERAHLSLEENTVVVVASKVVSIWQGRSVPVTNISKDELIKKEAQQYLPRDFAPHSWTMHTVKDDLLITASGVDTSNAKGFYILWPEKPMAAAQNLRSHLKAKFNLRNLGVLIIDSHSVPLHRGVTGITLGFAGFSPIKDYRGKKDLFGKTLEISVGNVADCLASAAMVVMGEGAEQTPLAVISDIPFVEFMENYIEPKRKDSSFVVPIDEDLFGPFIKSAPWKKGGK